MNGGRAVRAALEEPGTRWAAFTLAALLSAVLAAPLLSALLDVDPYAIRATQIYGPPSAAHLLGTDDLGRDVLARLLYGGRTSLLVSFAATLISVSLGGALGLAAGWVGGRVERALLAATAVALMVPRLPLLLILAAVEPPAALPFGHEVRLVGLLVLFGWVEPARLARAAARTLRGQDFITAARALGATEPQLLRVHVWPHAAAPLLVAAAIELGEVILYESALSFLGLGVPPPVPSWGGLLAHGMTYLHAAPQLLVLPGLLTLVAVAAAGRVAEGLRRAWAGR